MSENLPTTVTGTVTLRCPACRNTTLAQRERLEVWPYWDVLIHECGCGYIITESDWSEE